MRSAVVFDLQRSSFVDGPGIRTAVFLKGCDLRCAWCHNPESWTAKPTLLFFAGRCTGCGACAAVCPRDAIQPDGFPDPARCTACGACAAVCPSRARRLCGQTMTSAQVAAKAAEDKAFYDATGGGVTFTGGECLLQAAFVAECAALLREAGVSCAVDTAGAVPWEAVETVLPVTQLFLYDMKCLDAGRHMRYTGGDNQRILENLTKLLTRCPEKVEIRIPLIPGFNDDAAELTAMADWLAAHPPKRVTLLPYHAMGVAKAAACGEKVMECQPPQTTEMERWRELFRGRLHGTTVS